MARHSKWHKVKQFKGAIDQKRAASFTKLAREITVAAREKGGDPATNVRLKVAIDRAKKASMTKDTIERAIQRGAGSGAEGQLDQLTYEAYAPGGTALVIECVTDNRNRAANDVKHALSKNGGTFASSGAVTYLFDRRGVIRVAEDVSEDRQLALIDAGADDIQENAVMCTPQHLARVAETAQSLGLTVESAEFEWIPKMTVETDEASGTALEELIDALEDLDDVSRVYTNAA